MKIVICMDSWKGSLSAREVCEAVGEGIGLVCPEAEVVVRLEEGLERLAEVVERDVGVLVADVEGGGGMREGWRRQRRHFRERVGEGAGG